MTTDNFAFFPFFDYYAVFALEKPKLNFKSETFNKKLPKFAHIAVLGPAKRTTKRKIEYLLMN